MSLPIWFFSSHSWLWSRTNLWSPQPCLLRGNQLTRLRRTVPKYLQKFRHSLCSYHFVVLHCTDQALSSEASDHSRWPQYTPGKLQGSPVLLKYGRLVAKCDPWIHRATQGPTIDHKMVRLATNGFFRFCRKCFRMKVDKRFHRCTDIKCLLCLSKMGTLFGPFWPFFYWLHCLSRP